MLEAIAQVLPCNVVGCPHRCATTFAVVRRDMLRWVQALFATGFVLMLADSARAEIISVTIPGFISTGGVLSAEFSTNVTSGPVSSADITDARAQFAIGGSTVSSVGFADLTQFAYDPAIELVFLFGQFPVPHGGPAGKFPALAGFEDFSNGFSEGDITDYPVVDVSPGPLQITITPGTSIPEPGTVPILAIGLAGLLAFRSSRRFPAQAGQNVSD